MKTPIASSLLFALTLSSCFKVPLSATGKLDGSASGTVQAASTALGDGKEYASVDSDSKEPVQLTTPKASGLSGASVVIAPGSLGISVSIVVEQASDFGETSIANEMGLADNIQVTSASAGMIIRPSENVDLKKPLSLAMPLPTGLGFRLANLGSKYAIFYKYFDPTEQKLVTGLKVVDGVNVKMVFDEKSGKDVLQFEGYFGAYWAAILSREVAVSEVPPPKASEEPIINKAKVAVYNSTGVVKETEVVAKQAIPDLVWDKPSIKFLAATRTVSASVTVPKGHQASACKVDFFEAPNLPKGISLEVPLGTFAEYNVVKTTEHSLVARFRCVDEESRITITPWSNAVLVPAVVPVSTSASDIASAINAELCAATPSGLYAQGYNEYGQFITFQSFLPNGKCKYRATFNVENSGNFYITNQNSTIVCGLSTHSLLEGVQTISCQKGSVSSVGSNYMTIPSGNYFVDLDFSSSQSTGTLTVSKQPCDRGDFYLQFSSYFPGGELPLPTNTYPALSSASKMKHIGACEYTYDIPTNFTLNGLGTMQIRNAAGTYSCGRPNAGVWSSNQVMVDSCGVGPLSFDTFNEIESALSHQIKLSLGDAAKRKSNNWAQESYIEYKVQTGCPEFLYMLSTATGMIPDYQRNGAYRQGTCRYDFAVPVDSIDQSIYNFKLANQSGVTVCGGSSNLGVITLDCNPNASTINFQGHFGKTDVLHVSGDGQTGSLTSASIGVTAGNGNCNSGLYIQADSAAGSQNTKEKAFQEVSQCLFEKVWTPTSASEGFYVASGAGNSICGNYQNPTAQPSVNGAASSLFCNSVQYANDIAQIKPVNLVLGASYKITVDQRKNFTGNGNITINSYIPPTNCNEDLYILADSVIGNGKNVSTRMVNEGNCNYSFTLATPDQSLLPMQYFIQDSSSAISCYKGAASPQPYGSDSTRSEILDCGSGASSMLRLSVDSSSTYRFYLKRDPSNVRNQLTVQNLTDSYYGPAVIAGSAASLILPSDRTFNYSLSGGQSRTQTYVWTRSSASNFVLDRSGYGYEFCGLYGNTVPILGIPMNVICRFGSAASAPVFGNWSAGNYLIEYNPPKSVEELGTLRINNYNGLSVGPQIAATAADASLNRGPNGSLNQMDPSYTPGGLNGAATWADDSGFLWLYGGDNGSGQISSALWRYDIDLNRWVLMSGSLVGNVPPQTTSPARPGAKKFTQSWYDRQHGRLYLFGGYGAGLNSGFGEMNDLWYYEIASNTWHFVKGDLNVNAAGFYGSLGVANATNTPPPRMSGTTWVDSEYNMWLFAGVNGAGRYNDVWKFVPTSGMDSVAGSWTWMGGSQENVDSGGTGSYPSARSDAKVWYINSQAYMFGGTSGGSGYNDMWTFSCNAGATACNWGLLQANLGDVPMSLSRSGLFSPSNRPRYYGGGATFINAGSGDLWLYMETTFWVYRPSLNQWTAFPRLDGNGSILYNYPLIYGPAWASSVYNPDNIMGLRQYPLYWTSGSRHYLYGGYGTNASGYNGVWSDLWEMQLPSN